MTQRLRNARNRYWAIRRCAKIWRLSAGLESPPPPPRTNPQAKARCASQDV